MMWSQYCSSILLYCSSLLSLLHSSSLQILLFHSLFSLSSLSPLLSSPLLSSPLLSSPLLSSPLLSSPLLHFFPSVLFSLSSLFLLCFPYSFLYSHLPSPSCLNLSSLLPSIYLPLLLTCTATSSALWFNALASLSTTATMMPLLIRLWATSLICSRWSTTCFWTADSNAFWRVT